MREYFLRFKRRLHLVYLLFLVFKERIRQDKKWGGPSNDDKHLLEHWRTILNWYTHKYLLSLRAPFDQRLIRAREYLIKISAIALAAAESVDRKNGNGDFPRLSGNSYKLLVYDDCIKDDGKVKPLKNRSGDVEKAAHTARTHGPYPDNSGRFNSERGIYGIYS